MIERGGRAGFKLESPQAIRVVRKIGRQQFQRDVSIELRVARKIDDPHAAAPEE